METAIHETTPPITEIYLVQAGKGKRFLNYIIDLASFYLVLFFWGVLLGIFNPDAVAALDYEESNMGAGLIDRLVTLVLFGFYLSFIEAIFRGKSLGKLITGTKAVNEVDGSEISIKTAFIRGFSRMVPFEPFSALGDPSYPWHDQWSDTIVIDEKQSTR